jgi:flagellar biosynthesis GTPase FlhF
MRSTTTSNNRGNAKRASKQQGSVDDLATQSADVQPARQLQNWAFPPDLLQEPLTVRLKYFEEKIIRHDIIDRVFRDVMHAIRYPTKASIITLCGPTGVGKTTLLDKIIQQIIEDLANGGLITCPTSYPPIILEVPAPDSGYFRWRDFHERLLSELDSC